MGAKFSKRTAFAILIGNFLEYFDFLLYVHLLVVLSPLFFPKNNPDAQFYFKTTLFALGWLVRPIAALIFGYIADFISRKKMLVLSTLLMGCATFLIASLPTYAEIGILASILMFFCRFLQGFSNVGELVGSTIYLVEGAPKNKVNFYSSFVYVSSTLGALSATTCAYFCVKWLGEVPGWRVPFYIGSCIMFLGGFLRKMLPDDQPKMKKKVILWKELWEKKWPALGGILINMCHPVAFYLTYSYIPDLLKKTFNYSLESILIQSSTVLVYEIGLVMVLGYIGDKFSVLKIAYWRSISTAIFAIPCVALIVYGYTFHYLFFLAQIAIITLSHAEIPLLPTIVNRFSASRIYSSYGFVWSVGRSIMYGLGPFMYRWSENIFGTWGISLVLFWMAASYGLGIFLLFFREEAKAPDYLEVSA